MRTSDTVIVEIVNEPTRSAIVQAVDRRPAASRIGEIVHVFDPVAYATSYCA